MSALDWTEWQAEHEGDHKRRFRQALFASGALHVLAVGALLIAPEPEPLFLPQTITVDLVAAAPAPPAPAPPPEAAPEPPKPAPAPAPVAPPKPKVKILPKKPPAPAAKPVPKAKPEPVVRRARPKEMSYDDALAKLRDDLGEAAPVAPTQEAPKVAAVAPQAASQGSKGLVPPEVAAWILAVQRHVKSPSIYKMPPQFRNQGLQTVLEIDVGPDGSVLGEPRRLQSSGNPYFDDNAARAVLRADPLPVPPKPGKHTFVFTSEE